LYSWIDRIILSESSNDIAAITTSRRKIPLRKRRRNNLGSLLAKGIQHNVQVEVKIHQWWRKGFKRIIIMLQLPLLAKEWKNKIQEGAEENQS